MDKPPVKPLWVKQSGSSILVRMHPDIRRDLRSMVRLIMCTGGAYRRIRVEMAGYMRYAIARVDRNVERRRLHTAEPQRLNPVLDNRRS